MLNTNKNIYIYIKKFRYMKCLFLYDDFIFDVYQHLSQRDFNQFEQTE